MKYLCPLYQISGHSFPAAHSCWEVLRGKHLLPFQTLAGMVNSYMHIQFFRFLCHNFQSISSWRRQPQGSDFSIMKHPGKWIPVPDRIQDLQRILRKEAFAASTSKDLSVITDPADETSPQKISFAEISIPIKQESVRNGLHPDIILRKGPVSVEISNSVSAELLSRIGDIFHAE